MHFATYPPNVSPNFSFIPIHIIIIIPNNVSTYAVIYNIISLTIFYFMQPVKNRITVTVNRFFYYIALLKQITSV